MGSLLSTLFPVLFALAVLVIACAVAYKVVWNVRTTIALHRLTEATVSAERSARELVANLVIEIDSDPLLKNAVPEELQKEIWDLHERFNALEARKRLS